MKWRDCIASLGLIAAVVLLYRKVLGLWWTYDDAFHLHLGSIFSSAAILVSRHFWQQLPNKVFSPLLFLSLKGDWLLSGADARAFYVHHLIAFAALTITVYLVARLWLSPLRAFAVALIAMSGHRCAKSSSNSFTGIISRD